jgi:hypothetical protein
MPATPSKINGARAGERLTKALLDLAARGDRHHCADEEVFHLWLSDHQHERALVVKLCGGCPVQRNAGGAAVARDERFGVWGGIDRTRHPNGKAKIRRPRKIATPS